MAYKTQYIVQARLRLPRTGASSLNPTHKLEKFATCDLHKLYCRWSAGTTWYVSSIPFGTCSAPRAAGACLPHRRLVIPTEGAKTATASATSISPPHVHPPPPPLPPSRTADHTSSSSIHPGIISGRQIVEAGSENSSNTAKVLIKHRTLRSSTHLSVAARYMATPSVSARTA